MLNFLFRDSLFMMFNYAHTHTHTCILFSNSFHAQSIYKSMSGTDSLFWFSCTNSSPAGVGQYNESVFQS